MSSASWAQVAVKGMSERDLGPDAIATWSRSQPTKRRSLSESENKEEKVAVYPKPLEPRRGSLDEYWFPNEYVTSKSRWRPDSSRRQLGFSKLKPDNRRNSSDKKICSAAKFARKRRAACGPSAAISTAPQDTKTDKTKQSQNGKSGRDGITPHNSSSRYKQGK